MSQLSQTFFFGGVQLFFSISKTSYHLDGLNEEELKVKLEESLRLQSHVVQRNKELEDLIKKTVQVNIYIIFSPFHPLMCCIVTHKRETF